MNNALNIKVIKGKNPEEIAKSVEDYSNKLNAFSSPIIQDRVTNLWIGFIYYRTLNKEDESRQNKTIGLPPLEIDVCQNNSYSADTSTSKEVKPVPPTKKQIGFLKTNGWKGKLPDTKEEARIIISEAIERRNEI